MPRVRFAILFAVFAALLVALAGSARSQQPPKAAPPSKNALEITDLTEIPGNLRVGDEFNVTATVHNTRAHVLLANVRLMTSEQAVPIIPQDEQIVFLEGNVNREVKWRVRVVKAGAVRVSASVEVISEGRPLSGSLPGVAAGGAGAGALGPRVDVPASAKLALSKVWNGTWTSPTGFVYDAGVEAKLDPTGAVEARITWALKKAPASRTDYDGKIGLKGIEYAWGTYDPQSRMLYLESYRRDDPEQILGLEKYRLTLSENYNTMTGITWNHGTWDAAMSLVAK